MKAEANHSRRRELFERLVLSTYFATGFVRFGPRYLLNAMPPLLLLAVALLARVLAGRLTTK